MATTPKGKRSARVAEARGATMWSRLTLAALVCCAVFFMMSSVGLFVELHSSGPGHEVVIEEDDAIVNVTKQQQPEFPGTSPPVLRPAKNHSISRTVFNLPINASARRPGTANQDALGSPNHCGAPLFSAGRDGEPRGIHVLVTGLSRSGSTWQYNVVKVILENVVAAALKRGDLEDAETWKVASAHADAESTEFDTCLKSKICVLKTHVFVPRLISRVDLILSSHRDLRDVVLSSMLMFGSCFAPSGETKTMRTHGVAVRFQQYAHWTPYACYDMMYERMMRNSTRETALVAGAVLKLAPSEMANVDPASVVEEVAALSRKSVSCTTSKKKQRACWDASSGFSASHVHAMTTQPRAWSNRQTLDEVQGQLETCDVHIALRDVEAGFGGWLKVQGYAAEEQEEGGRSEPSYDGNWFVESLPEAAYLMDPALTLPRVGSPSMYPRFVHVINPFLRSSTHPFTKIGGAPVDEDALVHYSLSRAWRVARWSDIDVEIVAAMLEEEPDFEELATRWPTRRACALRNRLETANGMKLPLVRDLLECADANDSGAEWVVLTNPDIVLHPHFYVHLSQLVRDERRPFRNAWSVTRRQIAPASFADITQLFKTSGEPHLGHDTFVIPRSWLSQLEMGQLVPGFSPWGGALLASLAHLGKALVLGDKHWTFHLAEDGIPHDVKITSAEVKRRQATSNKKKRAEVCENAPGTFYNAREAARALQKTLREGTLERCCCSAADFSEAPHATALLPSPNAHGALSHLSGKNKPKVSPLALSRYEYIWDRIGPGGALTRCAALPGIQLLPPAELKSVVEEWCGQATTCSASPAEKLPGPDCTRASLRPSFENELAEDIAVSGNTLTVLVAYEKPPTPFEGGHVRVRQLLSWLCLTGHRVLLTHRDMMANYKKKPINASNLVFHFEPQRGGAAKLKIRGCTKDNLAVYPMDDKMTALSAAALARQRVDVAILTTWFYRTGVPSIPDVLLPPLRVLGKLRQRRIRIALLSDDVQYVRAKMVGPRRGDSPTYWEEVKHREMDLYGRPEVEVVMAISKDDAAAFEALRTPRPGMPPLAVLPYRASIDPKTVQDGWDRHGESWSNRSDVVFVGGGTHANREAVRWLLKEALPALRSLDSAVSCPAVQEARLILVGTRAWPQEAKLACEEATAAGEQQRMTLLCSNASSTSPDAPYIAPGLRAVGRIDDVGALLRASMLFLAPADVPSGISTKVWLALEHGLPVATTLDGGRGLPESARLALEKQEQPFVLMPNIGAAETPEAEQRHREAAKAFAERAAKIMCSKDRWRAAALASLHIAKGLESRSPWSNSALATLVSRPPQLTCPPPPKMPPADVDDFHRGSLLDAVEDRFNALRERSASCLDLVESFKMN